MGMLTSMLSPSNSSSIDNLTVSGVAVFKGAVTMQDTLTVSGAATFKTTVSIGGAATFGDNITVAGTSTLSGAVVANTTLNVQGAATFDDTLSVSGAAVFTGPVSFNGGVTYSGNAVVKGNLLVEGTTTLSGAAVANTTLNVQGATTLDDTLSVSGAVVAKTTLTVEGNSTFSGAALFNTTVTLSGNAVAKSNLLVEGTTTLSGNAVLNSNLDVQGTTSLSGNAVAKGSLLVEGATTLSGAATLKGTVTLEGAAVAKSTLLAEDTVTISGAATLKTTLNVEGATTLSGAAVAKSTLLVEGAATISGAATFNSTVTVSGAAVMKTTLNVEGTTSLSGNAVAKGNLLVEGTVTVSSSAVFKSSVVISGDISANNYGAKNIIIGGNFDTNPWQRGTSFTTLNAAASGSWTADRFMWACVGAGVVTVTKTADAPTLAEAGIYSSNCFHVDVTTVDSSLASTDQYSFKYKVEGYDFAHIFGRAYTLSFWHKHTLTGTYCVSFYNNAGDQYYVAEYTQSTTDTWEKATITVPAYSTGTWLLTNGKGLEISFAIAMGSDYNQATADTWTAATAQYATTNQVNAMAVDTYNFKLALVKLEFGSVATPYPIQNEADVLARCQRYYEKSFDNDTAPAQNAGDTAGAHNSTQAVGASTFEDGHYIFFKVKKRTGSITVTTYNPSAANAQARNISRGTDASGISVTVNDENGCNFSFTSAAGSAAGDRNCVNWTASAEL